MKKNRTRLLAALALCMLLLGAASAALAQEYRIWIGGVQVTDANKDNIAKDIPGATGSARLTEEKRIIDGDEIIRITYLLTLTDFHYTGTGDGNAAIYIDEDVTLALKGTNSVTQTGNTEEYGESCGLYALNSLTVTGPGSLTATGGPATWYSYGVMMGSEDPNITIKGAASLTGIGGAAGNDSCGVRNSGNIDVLENSSLTGIGGPAEGDSCGVKVASDSVDFINISEGSLMAGTGGTAKNSYGMYFGPKTECIVAEGGMLTGTGGKATGTDGVSYGVNNGYDSDYSEGVVLEGGLAVAQGETRAFFKAPKTAGYTGAKVWYGDSEAAADERGAQDSSANVYDQKYVCIAAVSLEVSDDGNGTAFANAPGGGKGVRVAMTAEPRDGYRLKEWQVVSGDATVSGNIAILGEKNAVIKAIFEPIPAQDALPMQPELPQTGDRSSLLLWLSAGLASAAGMLLLRRKAYGR